MKKMNNALKIIFISLIIIFTTLFSIQLQADQPKPVDQPSSQEKKPIG